MILSAAGLPGVLGAKEINSEAHGLLPAHCTEEVQHGSERELKIKDEEATQLLPHPWMKSSLCQKDINHSLNHQGEKSRGATQP